MILTDRLKLQMPEVTTDNMFDGDNVLSHNYDLIDLNAHCRVIDALVDVTDPFDGQHVHVLGTGINYIRKDGEWALFAEPVSGGGSGNKGSVQLTTKTAVTVPNEVKLVQITFTPEVAKRYLIKASINMGLNSADGPISVVRAKMRWATGTNVTTAGTVITTSQFGLLSTDFGTPGGSPGDFSTVLFDEIFPNNTTQLSVGLFLENTTAGGTELFVSPDAMGSGAGFVTYSNLSAYDWGA